MATSKYTIAPPSLAPLLHEYGDYDNIPEDAWREYIAAQSYWARSWLMYAGPPQRKRRNLSAGQSPPSERAPPAAA